MNKRSSFAFVLLSILLHLLIFTSVEFLSYRITPATLELEPDISVKIIDFTEDDLARVEEPDTARVLGQKSTKAHDNRLDVERSDRPKSKRPMLPEPRGLSNPSMERWTEVEKRGVAGEDPALEPSKSSEAGRVATLAEPSEIPERKEEMRGAIRLETDDLQPQPEKRVNVEAAVPPTTLSPAPNAEPPGRGELTADVEPLERFKDEAEEGRGPIQPGAGRLKSKPEKKPDIDRPVPAIILSPGPIAKNPERGDLMADIEPLDRLNEINERRSGAIRLETGDMEPRPENRLEVDPTLPDMLPSPIPSAKALERGTLMADVEPLDRLREKLEPAPHEEEKALLKERPEDLLPSPEIPSTMDRLVPETKGDLYVRADALNVREEPNTSSRVLERLKRDQKLSLVDEEGGWYRVLLENGRAGYVKREYVANARREADAPLPSPSIKEEKEPAEEPSKEKKEIIVAAREAKRETEEPPSVPGLSLEGIPSSDNRTDTKRGMDRSGRDLNLLPDDVFSEFGQVVVSEVEASDGKDAVSLDTTEWRYFSYFSKIKREIEEIWRYPREAALMGKEGEMDMRFIIARSGELKEIKLIRSSGYRMLDEAAIYAVRDAAPFGPFPHSIDRDFIRIDARFKYILSNSPYRYEVLR